MPGDPENNLVNIAAFIKQSQSAAQIACRYGQNLRKFSMLQRNIEFPKLRGKAAELRHVGHAIKDLWVKYHNPKKEVHREILQLLELDLRIDSILDKYSPEDGYFAVPSKPAKTNQGLSFEVNFCSLPP